MRSFLISAAMMFAVAAPALAQWTTPGELQQDRREIYRDQRQLDRARAYDPTQIDDRRDDLRESRREYRDDLRDRGEDRRDYDRRYANDDRRDYNRYYGDGRRDGRTEWRYVGNRYDLGRYYAPRGYAYRPWAAGAYLPRSYWQAQRNWIANPVAYRLSPAWQGVRWVRVGPDALLIRTRNGVVVSSVRGLFL